MKSNEVKYHRAVVAAAREAIVVWKDAEHASLFFSRPEAENRVYNYLVNTGALDGKGNTARQRNSPAPGIRLYEVRVLKQFADEVIAFPDFNRNRLAMDGAHCGAENAVLAAMKLWYVLNEPKTPPAPTPPPEKEKPAPKYNIEGLSDDELMRRMRENLGVPGPRKPGAPDSPQPRRR